MGINVFNGLGSVSLAGSRSFLRERVENLRKEWHTVDTVLFAGRSAVPA